MGASLAALSAAARLRRLNEDARIIITDPRRNVPSLQRLRAVYNIDVRLYTDANFTEDSGCVMLEDKLTGLVRKEIFDKLIISHVSDDGNSPTIRSVSSSILNLTDCNQFISQWDVVERFITEKRPSSAIIYGGNIIAAMAAGRLLLRGLQITIIALSSVVPNDLDRDIACHITSFLVKHGVRLVSKSETAGLYEEAEQVFCPLNGDAISADMAINCRQKPLHDLPTYTPPPIGVEETLQEFPLDTIARNIFSGLYLDMPSLAPLKGRAVAADVINSNAGRPKNEDGLNLRQYEIFGKHIAIVGLIEKELNELRLPYIYSIVPIPGGFLKLIYSANGDVLGFASIGQDALHYANIIAIMTRLGCSISNITEIEMTAVAQPLQNLCKIAQNVVENRLFMAYWDEIINADIEKITLVDVRPPALYLNYNLPNSINIPLANLRENMHNLDISKEIIIYCDNGEDSYIASCILAGKVPNLRHLTGGLDYYKKIAALMA